MRQTKIRYGRANLTVDRWGQIALTPIGCVARESVLAWATSGTGPASAKPRSQMWQRATPRVRIAAAFAAVSALLGGSAYAAHLATDTDGHTTVEQTIVPAEGGDGYTELTLGPGEPYVVRDGASEGNSQIPTGQTGREDRRVSLAYLSQLTDFQLADEESPARVEFLDPGAHSAWRPQEGFTAFQIDATVRQINHFTDASPVPQGDGTRNSMDFALLTGDQADNQHRNETVWVRDLLEGNGLTNLNSGLSNPADYANPAALGASCPAFVLQEGGAANAAAEGARYTGVQDYDDYPVGAPATPLYYDPDEPRGPDWADWPEYDGLMDRAQQISIDPEGLDVPFYITNGNHDVLAQGNEDANAAFEDTATGCFKALATTANPTTPPEEPDPDFLLTPASPAMLVPPDPQRQFVSKPQIKEIYGATDEGPGDDDHGFAYVDGAENQASNGSASYYAWDPVETLGMRFVSIDTNSEGGQTAEGVGAGSSNGNLDDPQFQWLKRELAAAEQRSQLVVIFGHHPVRSMNTEIRDEQAAPCTGVNDEHGHDVNPGCDLDPRPSDDDPATPGFGCIHNGTDEQNSTCAGGDAQHESFVELIDQFPNVIAYLPGHTHEHRLTPFVRSDGTTWWEINTSAVIDYPNQSRLVEFMDNRDGTLSIFNTVVNHAAPATAPGDCPDAPTEQPDCAAGFDHHELASIGRTLSFNDPHNDFSGAGRPIDRNAELLLEDPRPAADLSIAKADGPDPVIVGESLTYTLTATNNGPSESTGTMVTDELPDGVSVSDVESEHGTCTQTVDTVECDLGTLPSGASREVTITVVPQAEGTITNRSRIRGNVSDTTPANDSATATTTAVPPPSSAVICATNFDGDPNIPNRQCPDGFEYGNDNPNYSFSSGNVKLKLKVGTEAVFNVAFTDVGSVACNRSRGTGRIADSGAGDGVPDGFLFGIDWEERTGGVTSEQCPTDIDPWTANWEPIETNGATAGIWDFQAAWLADGTPPNGTMTLLDVKASVDFTEPRPATCFFEGDTDGDAELNEGDRAWAQSIDNPSNIFGGGALVESAPQGDDCLDNAGLDAHYILKGDTDNDGNPKLNDNLFIRVEDA